MNKKLMIVFAFAAIAVMTVGLISSGAWWNVITTATDNNYQAATFDMTIGNTGTHTVSGACHLENMAPAIPLLNAKSGYITPARYRSILSGLVSLSLAAPSCRIGFM